jgi:hypothetical protein
MHIYLLVQLFYKLTVGIIVRRWRAILTGSYKYVKVISLDSAYTKRGELILT